MLKLKDIGIRQRADQEAALRRVHAGVAASGEPPFTALGITPEIKRTGTRFPFAVIGKAGDLAAACFKGDARVYVVAARHTVDAFDSTAQRR